MKVPVGEPPGKSELPHEAPPGKARHATVERPPDPDSAKPTPQEQVQKLRLGVRLVWWSAVILAVGFVGVALWLGLAKHDPFALFYAVLAACCALAGYGTLVAVRRRPAS